MRLLSSLRSRLILLVLLAVLPALAMVLYGAMEQRREQVAKVQQDVLTFSRLLAREKEKEFEQASLLLGGLARLDVVREASGGCGEVLRPVQRGYPRYLNIGVIDVETGEVLCSVAAGIIGRQLSAAGQAAVRESAEGRGFAVSGFTVGQLSRRPLVMLSHAIVEDANPVTRAVYASFSLDWLGRAVSDVDLVPGSTSMVVDDDGVILSRYPDPETWIGSTISPGLHRIVAERSPGEPNRAVDAVGMDGVTRTYAAVPLRLADGRIFGHLYVGVPIEQSLLPVQRDLRRNLIWLALLTVVALLAAWFGGEFFVLRPVDSLLRAAQRLESGDRTARAGLADGGGELERLGMAFDRMAESLQARQEEAERSSAKLLRQALVLETLLEGVIVTDPQGLIVELNPAAESLFGYSREELLGKSPAVFHDPALHGRLEDQIVDSVVRDGRWSGEIPFVRRDGTRGVSEALVVAQFDAAGERIGHIGVNRDVTERREAQEAIRRSEESYRSLFNSLTDLVYVHSLDARFLEVNDVVLTVQGYTREELIGKTPPFVLDPERTDEEEIDRRFGRVAAGGPPDQMEVWARRKDGTTFPMDVVLTRSTYFGQEVVIVVGRDVSTRKQAEEALRQREEELRQAQKMEAVGRLAGGIAHDFNNLLTAIKGNAELALLDVAASSPLRAELEQIQQAAETATTLTRQLLAFSRKQSVTPEVVPLNGVIGSTSKLLQRLIGAKVELVSELEPELWPVRADPGQLEQILMNLAVNARDAMSDGGTLRIRTANLALSESDPGRPSYVEAGRYVLLAVSDNGSGMEPAVQERVFEPFFTTKAKEKGTGLGLFTVYGIVRQSGGHVWVESEPGRGTTVRILLPDAGETPARNAAAEGAGLSEGAETVLLVEDEAGVRLLAHRLLQRIGYRVLVAENGEHALRVSEGYDGRIDLLLTDMTMPKMGGAEVARRLRGLRPGLKVVFMSGYTEESLGNEFGVDGGAPAFVQKPFTLNILANAVREALDSGH